jgi:ABC-2 type transport system ATP-binding protein
MDEAERCHEIAYIAYGELLAHGTVAQVIGQSHLVTYVVTGPDLASLADGLRRRDGIDMVAPFGASLHVSGRDAGKLDAAIASYRDNSALGWQHAEPSLEDVFIEMMGRSQDNFKQDNFKHGSVQ